MSDIYESITLDLDKITDERIRRIVAATDELMDEKLVSAGYVKVVRCRDCKNAQVLHPLNPITGVPAGIEYWRCAHFWNADELCDVEPDGFCAWGERRDA